MEMEEEQITVDRKNETENIKEQLKQKMLDYRMTGKLSNSAAHTTSLPELINFFKQNDLEKYEKNLKFEENEERFKPSLEKMDMMNENNNHHSSRFTSSKEYKKYQQNYNSKSNYPNYKYRGKEKRPFINDEHKKTSRSKRNRSRSRTNSRYKSQSKTASKNKNFSKSRSKDRNTKKPTSKFFERKRSDKMQKKSTSKSRKNERSKSRNSPYKYKNYSKHPKNEKSRKYSKSRSNSYGKSNKNSYYKKKSESNDKKYHNRRADSKEKYRKKYMNLLENKNMDFNENDEFMNHNNHMKNYRSYYPESRNFEKNQNVLPPLKPTIYDHEYNNYFEDQSRRLNKKTNILKRINRGVKENFDNPEEKMPILSIYEAYNVKHNENKNLKEKEEFQGEEIIMKNDNSRSNSKC